MSTSIDKVSSDSKMNSSRGIRLMSAIKYYTENFKSWDSSSVFSKIKVLSIEDGKVSAEFKVTEDISNMSNGLHGGFTSSLIDTLCAFGLISHPQGALAFTTNIDISLMSQARDGDTVAVTVAPLSMNKTRAVMEAYLMNQRNNELVAKGTVSVHIPHKPISFYDKFPFDPKLRDLNIEIASG